MHLHEAMETTSAGTGGRKKLKHRLAAILSAFSRRGGRKRCDSESEEKTPLAFPSFSRLGNGIGKKAHGAGMVEQPRRFSVSAPRAPPLLHITIDCAGRRSVDAADPSILPLPFAPLDADAGLNRKAGGGEWEGRKCPPSSPFVAAHLPPLPPVARWRERASNTNSSSSRRHSTHTSSSSRRERTLMASSSSSDDEYDEADSRRNLFSSRSFSSDSSDFYNCPLSRSKNTATTTTTRARASISGPCRAPPQSTSRRGASQSCRYSFELPRGSTASDGGFAVVKRSADPYEDFRKSMQEMIAEWPADGGEGDGAERLLETYLVLNSPRHYPAILAAFADVRETLFP
ncbi:hypothetical protein QOZ80_1AG0032110 [Eleusine coracana subsp. coracana]|nr:hypothetical protein QOZ80_1AG0032110 [Eleusine coracana subsp. coracana]